MLQVFAPARPNGTSLLIFPGGGYHGLSWKNEGTDMAGSDGGLDPTK